MITKIKLCFISAFMGLILSGCVSLVPEPKGDPASLISLHSLGKYQPHFKKKNFTLAVTFDRQNTFLDSENVAASYENDKKINVLTTLEGVKWAEALPDHLERQLFASLLSSNAFSGVSLAGYGTNTDGTLLLTLDRFEVYFKDRNLASPQVRIKILATLIYNQGYKIVANKIFEAKQDVASNRNIQDGVKTAFDSVWKNAQENLIAWARKNFSKTE